MSHAKPSDGTDWRKRLRAHAESLGREVYEDELGVGIEFEDGCDAFWVLPGEVIATVPVPAEGPASVDDLIAEYERINHLRERAIHVIWHYLASRKYRIGRRRDGQWFLQRGVEQHIGLGAWLTTLARAKDDVYGIVRTLLKESACIKPPSPRRIDRYLNMAEPPKESLPIFEDEEDQETGATASGRSTIREALAWLGLCRAIENPDNFTSREKLEEAAAPRGPIGQALLRLHEHLPDADAYVDFCAPAALSIAFDDGLDALSISTKSRRLARRIREAGPEQIGDELADEYRSLNMARRQVLGAIYRTAAERGWRKDEMLGMPLLGIEPVVHLGHTRREVSFDPAEKLTRLLRRQPPEKLLRRILADDPDFAEACVAALHTHPQGEPPHLPKANLAPKHMPAPPPLRELTPEVVAEMDAWVDRVLQAHLQDDDTLWQYKNREAFDPDSDTTPVPYI